MAAATAAGIFSTSRVNGLKAAVRHMSTPANRKAPSASAKLVPTALVATSTTPGVDHAVITGIR
jgi:hypothetical protein